MLAGILMLCYFNSCSQQSVEDVAPTTAVFVLDWMASGCVLGPCVY